MGLELSSAQTELQKEGPLSCSCLTQLHSIQNKLGGQEVLANKGLMKKTGTVFHRLPVSGCFSVGEKANVQGKCGRDPGH